MKKFAVVAMSAVAFLSAFDSSEAQVLRRFRDNVREAIAPQMPTQTQVRPYNPTSVPPQYRSQPGVSSQQRYSQPQVMIQRPAPQGNLSAPQQLTPYSRLTPQQRASIPGQQPTNTPRLNAPAPVGRPTAQPTTGSKIRIVTYVDPRTGRTFQRRYLIPGDSPTVNSRPSQVATDRRSIFTQPSTSVATRRPTAPAATANLPTAGSLVPPIQFSAPVEQQAADGSPGLLPALAGPTLGAPAPTAQQTVTTPPANPTATVKPIAASIENSSDSKIKTASAEIPDLSGIVVEPATVDSAEETRQDLFFDDGDASDDASEGPSFSILEVNEEG